MSTATIKINRDSGYVDRIRAYHVVLDGEKITKISNGGSVELDVEPGEHELYLKIDWCRSNKINFSISEGQTKTYNGGSSLRGFMMLLAIIYVTVQKNSYLWLEESFASQ